MNKVKPLVLIILDGWGFQEDTNYNAIAGANTPQWDNWSNRHTSILLEASGPAVGLPVGQMGNSEVGHMHIGAGRMIYQDFTRINAAINEGSFIKNSVFLQLINDVKAQNTTLHIMGLLSSGGVHSHQDHLFAFLRLCHAQHLKQICLHLFLDGRDTSPQSALESISALNKQLEIMPHVKVCSMSGRYFSMDRNNRWERIQQVYELLTENKADYQFPDAEIAIKSFYNQQITDEFIPPTRIGQGQAIHDNDSVFFFNFRADRARQLTECFINPAFSAFKRAQRPSLAHFVSMTSYASNLPTEIAFPQQELKHTFGEVIAHAGLHQLRLAETEKYAHVTFFFNGGIEQPFVNEKRILIPSPSVATYDLKPGMSALELTDTLIESIKENQYDVIICNYANADMVGHTGNYKAAVQAIECLDQCMHKINLAIETMGGTLLITADHGNAEIMYDESTHQAHTAHTCQPVPLVYTGKGWHFNRLQGSLIDIAPTMLALLGLAQPAEMTGTSLLTKNDD